MERPRLGEHAGHDMTSNTLKQLCLGSCILLCSAASIWLYIAAFDLAYVGLSAGLGCVLLIGALRLVPAQSEQIREALNDGYLGVALLDKNGHLQSLNQNLHALFGGECDSPQGEHISNVCGEDIWMLVADNPVLLRQGHALRLEFETQINQRKRHLSAQIKRLQSRWGTTAGYVLQIEDRTRTTVSQRMLDDTSQQMRRLFAHSSDLVFVLTPKLKVSFVNETAATTLDTATGIFINTPIYSYIEATKRRDFMQGIEKLMQEDRNEISLGEIEFCGNTCTRMRARLISLSGGGYALIGVPTLGDLTADDERQGFERFSKVFHASPDAILILREEDSLIIDFNQGFQNLLGYTREQIIGESGIESGFWQHASDRQHVISRLATEGEITGHETTLRTVDGRLVHVEISLRYIDVDQDLCILCIGRDITKRISAEAALRETEEKFASVFNKSPDGIIVFRRADNAISDVNNAFKQRSGFSNHTMREADLDDFLTAVDGDSSELRQCLEQGITFVSMEVTFITKDNTRIPSLVSGTSLELSGEPHMMLIAKDMTSQHETEERLRRSEARFRGIFEHAPIGILLVDPQGEIFQANLTAGQLLDYDVNQLNGLHISRLVPKEGRVTLKQALEDLLKPNGLMHYSGEQRLSCQSGIELWSTMNIALQRDTAGEPLYYIVQMVDITEMKTSQTQMEKLAFYDTLTNLANRRLFHDRLNSAIEACQRRQHSGALIYLDLDNFKRVNDTLGHQTGDQLLQEVANRLRLCVRKEDTVGRGGGDEFTIVLREIRSSADAGMVAQKILNHLREPIVVDGHPMVVTTSIGITLFPDDGAESNTLLGNADLAMYRAKERGRNNFQFYSDDLNANAAKRLRVEYEIGEAISQDQFELFYQPKVSLASGKIVGVETLIRWNHPERGLLTPDEFIEIAEDTGSIIDIGTWVIDAACKAAHQLRERVGNDIGVAVNLSPRQFRDPNLLSTIRRGLREQAIHPKNFEIEITETMLMQDVEAAQRTVERLRELGIGLAIDDFGTGYSSLNYLRRFPIDTVKIDRSFIMDLPNNLDDLAITRAVIAMAHQLKMKVVAEGVETREQVSFLASEQCEFAQGYHFSKPVPLNDVVRLIRQTNRDSVANIAHRAS